MTFYRILLTTAALCIGTHSLKAQSNEKELTDVLTYMKRAMMFNKSLPQEKVYLHFDNTGYFKGETIWFKAYVVRADYAVPTNKSKVLYVELVNPMGDVVETKKLAIQNGTAHGDIKLDSIIGNGFFEVRAYTRYMTNWGNGGIFSRVFPIFDAPQKPGDYTNLAITDFSHKRRLPNLRSNDDISVNDVTKRDICVHFYPEGGHLVKGLPTRVAYYVTDRSGAYKDMGGALLDENKEAISATNTFWEGKGVFEITPDDKPKYLRLADEKGKQHEFKLPEAEDEGIVMNLNMLNNDEITATLTASPALHGKLLGYTMIHNGIVIKGDTLTCEPAIKIPFDRASLPKGVSQLTFFTADGHIQAERQFFICPESNNADTIRITSPNKYPKPCGKVVLDIQAQPNSNLSLSAIDVATMVNGKEGNALTWMLLTSDIKGYISKPEFYFEADDKRHRMAADLLMMVQGWKRYDWALMADALEENKGYSMFTKETALFDQPAEDKLYLLGTLKAKSKKNPVDNTWLEATLYNRSGQSLKGTAKTDSLGNYAFSLPDVDGEWTMFINTGREDKHGYWKDANYYVGIDRHFSPKRRIMTPAETEPVKIGKLANLFNDEKSKKAAEDDNVYIPIQKREVVLPTVWVKARRRIFDNARIMWESEDNARRHSPIYYNADKDADLYCDLGMEVPTLYKWLCTRNPFFTGSNRDYNLTESQAAADFDTQQTLDKTATLGDLSGDIEDPNDAFQQTVMTGELNKGLNGEDLDEGRFHATSINHRIYEDGIGYKNRPIIWILNNAYASITNLGRVANFSTFEVLQNSIEDMPIFIDEVKSAYISEDPDAFKSYLYCPDIQGRDPVTVYLYTHYKLPFKAKGMRKTHFNGYNVPSTFEMEDYNYLPPMEDFRRTIFWAPDVKTNAEGKAQVEFWNNSSCHEMYISAEGLSPKGHFLINK